MRTERTYHVSGSGPWYIETTETTYCEDPKCERQHDDPRAKWDVRCSRGLAELHSLADAERVVEALRGAEAKAGRTVGYLLVASSDVLKRGAACWTLQAGHIIDVADTMSEALRAGDAASRRILGPVSILAVTVAGEIDPAS